MFSKLIFLVHLLIPPSGVFFRGALFSFLQQTYPFVLLGIPHFLNCVGSLCCHLLVFADLRPDLCYYIDVFLPHWGLYLARGFILYPCTSYMPYLQYCFMWYLTSVFLYLLLSSFILRLEILLFCFQTYYVIIYYNLLCFV